VGEEGKAGPGAVVDGIGDSPYGRQFSLESYLTDAPLPSRAAMPDVAVKPEPEPEEYKAWASQ